MDIDSPKLRLRAQPITSFSPDPARRAVAIFAFVNRRPFRMRPALRPRTAEDVLVAGCGDAADKATLLVALLRAVGVPAGGRVLAIRGELLEGLTSAIQRITRPLVEVYVDASWQQTDTYIFPAQYQIAARNLLQCKRAALGYGMHVAGDMYWWAQGSLYLCGIQPDEDPMVLANIGCFHDVGAYEQFRRRAQPHARLIDWARMVLLARSIQKNVESVLRSADPQASAARD